MSKEDDFRFVCEDYSKALERLERNKGYAEKEILSLLQKHYPDTQSNDFVVMTIDGEVLMTGYYEKWEAYEEDGADIESVTLDESINLSRTSDTLIILV